MVAALVSIDTQLYILSGGLVLGTLIAAWQAFKLRRVYRSFSSLIGSFTFLLLGGRQIYSFGRLRSNIAEARAKGFMIDHLSAEQWIVGVAWGYAIVLGFILWQHMQHKDLEKLSSGGE